jgi:hypothetical protein
VPRVFLDGAAGDCALHTITPTTRAADIAARRLAADGGAKGRGGIGGLTAALDVQGLISGAGRVPRATPDGDAIEDIEEALATAGLL